MTEEAKGQGLLADYLEAAREEREAWQALADCDQSRTDCTGAFLRWKRAAEVSQQVAVRWRAAVVRRRNWPWE